MITLTEQPPSIPTADFSTGDEKQPPVSVSDCWKWCLQPDAADAVATAGAKATVVVTFPATTTVPADGTPFKIWGYDFTVDSSEDYTSSSFKVTTSGLTTFLNFSNMIQANIFFNRAVTISATIVGGAFEVTITWNECREQPRFVEEQMDFSGIEATGATAEFTNGTSPEYVDGYRILTRVGYLVDATSEFKPISKFSGLDVDKNCTTVGEVCTEYKGDIQTQLYTDLPDLTTTSFIPSIQGGRSLMRLFALEYGWVYRENCGAKSGTIKKSDIVLGINAAFDVDDPYQMRRYWYNHPDGFPPGQFVADFLTTQPKSMTLHWDSFKWLWLLNNWQNKYGTYRLVARFAIYKKGVGYFEAFEVIINNPTTDGHAWYQPVNFNVSPQYVADNAPTLTKAEIDFYEVSVKGTTTGGDTIFNASEILTFRPEGCCEGTTDIYFLEPPGGIGTMIVKIDEKEVVQEGQEVALQTTCGIDRFDRARYGGRTLMNLRSYERITFSINAPNTVEWVRWLKHFRSSPQHWIRVSDEAGSNLGLGGNPIAKKLIIEPGAGKIYENGKVVEFKATGYLADIPTQIGIEP